MNESQLDEKRSYEALLDLVDESKRHLDTLRLEPDSRRPDVLPGIPQAILPVLRRVVQQSQAFKAIIRVPIKGRNNNGIDDDGKKRRREEASQRAITIARSKERQMMKDKLDEHGKFATPCGTRLTRLSAGTNIWNKTLQIHRVIKTAKDAPADDKDRSRMQMRHEAMGHWEKLFAYCRYAAYSLIQVAGEERSGNARLIMRNLELAIKTSLALYASKDQEEAREIMGTAAELENALSEKLLNGLDGLAEDTLLRAECSRNIIEYYLARCTLEVDRNNETVAGTLIAAALAHCNTTSNDVPTRSLQAVAKKCHETGCALLARITEDSQQANPEQDAENALTAVKWFRHGIQLVESKEGNPEVYKTLAQYKTPLLEGLARASILSADMDKDALNRAQAITDDLLRTANLSENRDKVQAFLTINLNILRRKKAPSPDIAKVMERIIDLINWQDEDGVNRVLAEVEQPPINPKEAIALYRYFLKAASQDAEDRRREYVVRILLSLTLLLQKQEPFYAGQELHKILDAIAAIDNFRLESAPAIAAGTMIWKTADRLSVTDGTKPYAAEWFLAGAHAVFGHSMEPKSRDKWRRRAVMCFLTVNDYAKAEEHLWTCDPENADTIYLQFCLDLAMGRATQACDAVKKLGKASNCTERHLSLAMQAVSSTGDDSVVRATMRALLSFKPKDPKQSSEDVTLIRGLIRMYLKDVTGNSVPSQAIPDLLGLYRQALEICRDLESKGRLAVYSKDTAWLYKTAYNLAIEGISTWDNTNLIVECFDVAVDLMKVYRTLPGVAVDPLMQKQMIRGIHASLCGSVFAARVAESDQQQEALWQKSREQLAELKDALDGPFSAQGVDCSDFRVHSYILEVEILGKHRQWDEIATLLQNISPEACPIQVCEAIAGLGFWCGVPAKVSHALQSLALQILVKENKDIFGFLRWSRSMIELLIHRKGPGDFPDALAQIQAAKQVAEGHKPEVQGCNEVEWLLTTTWNQGLELLSLSNPIGQAKLWLETAISFCSLAANGETRLNHMRKVYE